MADWPTTDEVRAFMRLPSPMNADDESVLAMVLRAATGYGNYRTNHRFDAAVNPDAEDVPDPCHYACTLHASRLYRRRDSTDGTLGISDAGVVHIGRYDSDIENNYAIVCPIPVG